MFTLADRVRLSDKGFFLTFNYIRVIEDYYNIDSMAKKTKKEFVWEKTKPKIRKIREKRIKEKEDGEQIEFSESKDQVEENQIQQEVVVDQSIPKQVNNQQVANEKPVPEKKEPTIEKLEKQVNQQEFQKLLNQKLTIIKQILYSEQKGQGNNKMANAQDYRSQECKEIVSFLTKKDDQCQQNCNILYIYGTPGSGKTYTIKNILKKEQLEGKAKWINCLTMLNKSLLRYVQPLVESKEKNNILIIDEFDQMQKQFKNMKFIKSLKSYLKQVLNKSFVENIREVKFIFISNHSYESINQEFIHSVKTLLKFDSIRQIPFLPYTFPLASYTASDIKKILDFKAEAIHSALGQTIFTNSYLEIVSKRQYSKSQDIRKVINYIYTHFQSTQLKKISASKKVPVREIMGEDRGVEAEVIRNMAGRQRGLFWSLLHGFSEMQDQSKPFLTDALYRQGSKSGIQRNIVDLWLQQWVECGLITLRPFQSEGHSLYKLKSISTRLNYRDYQRQNY